MTFTAEVNEYFLNKLLFYFLLSPLVTLRYLLELFVALYHFIREWSRFNKYLSIQQISVSVKDYYGAKFYQNLSIIFFSRYPHVVHQHTVLCRQSSSKIRQVIAILKNNSVVLKRQNARANDAVGECTYTTASIAAL